MNPLLDEGLHVVAMQALDANDSRVAKFTLEVYPMPAELCQPLFDHLKGAVQSFFESHGAEFGPSIDVTPKGPLQ